MKKITLNEMDEYIGRCPHYVDGRTVEYLAQLEGLDSPEKRADFTKTEKEVQK